MEIKDAAKLIDSFKKQPVRTFCAIVVLILLLSVIAYFTAFYGEKGKRAAGLPEGGPHIEQSSKDFLPERRKAEPRPTINQHTEGDQAPAVNVAPGGKVNINYGAPKDRGTQE